MNQQRFLSTLNRLIEQNISKPDFGIKEICQELKISRAQLHRILKKATKKSTSLYIRSIRMRRAKQLLITSELNVSEVGYAVGYENRSHFSQDFKSEFGYPPSHFKS
ncbi:MAG: helix-turn-helix transcriptional regulator [Saprospiraceae bacterium]|nr:helix-turn-helix transcriptional regulator [Saprospiraceae bacterium]